MHKLAYLRELTDDFGVWQHSKGDEIDRDMGYALDDSARALIVYLQYGDKKRAKVCLDYLDKSQTTKGFIGFFDGQRRALDDQSSDDAFALAIWALAEAISQNFYPDQAHAILAKTNTERLIKKGYLRTLTYLLLAHNLLGDRQTADILGKKITAQFNPNINWFEERLTYANAAIPLALLRYKRTFKRKDAGLDNIIKQSIATLEEYSRIGIIPAPVGNRIWQRIGAVERDIYGQQPIDAAFMVLMLVEAFTVFGEQAYLSQAKDWMEWFHGNNIYKANLIAKNNACADGLNVPSRGVADNKGAESVIMYVMALHAYKQAKG